MKKNIFIISIVAVVVGIVAAIIFSGGKKQTTSATIKVTTSFYPLYFFAQQIGGDKTTVTNITPSGAEPHDYEPTPQDIVTIDNSKLLILNGGGLEAWGNSIKQNINPNQTTIIVAGEGLATQQVTANGQQIIDPHFWLSPPLAKQMVDKITQGFISADQANQTYYQTNADSLKTKLDGLDTAYRKGLSNCINHDIITSHTAFGYLASTYGLTQVPITGLSPDVEPSSQQLVDIVGFAKKNNIKYIFFESLVSPKLAQTIAMEVGAQTLVLNPIEGLSKEELAQGQDYFSVMQSNLTNLQTALQCKK